MTTAHDTVETTQTASSVIRIMMQQIRWRLQRWWSRRSEATRSLPGYIWKAISNYIRSGSGSRQAAALSYFAIFSVFPLVLLISVVIGSLVGPAVAQEQIVRGLQIFLPDATVDDIQLALTGALEQSGSFGLVATAALLWAATGLFTNITLALDNIFSVPSVRSIWRQRLLAVLMGITLVVLVVASFLTSGVLRLIAALSPGSPSIWITIGTLFLPLGLDVVIFALLFRYVPARDVHWDAIWPTAIFGSLGWELAKRAFEWYLANLAEYQVIYGSVTTGIVLLFWAWLIASIFLFSAELCARLNEWFIEQEERRAVEREQSRLVSVYLREEMLPPPPTPAPVLDDDTP